MSPYPVFRRTALAGVLCVLLPAGADAQQTTKVPPSNLPGNTPGGYSLIVPVVGQEQSEWCWATSTKMAYEYDSPLPRVIECQEANIAFGQTSCCTNGGSAVCDQGDGGPQSYYNFSYFSAPATMTWDQLRYQVWSVNKPFMFGWDWVGGGAHIMVVTGYAAGPRGSEMVEINNPEPVGQGDAQLMTYDEWVQDTDPNDPFGAHTHEGDWYDATFNGTRIIYNLATNMTVPTNAVTEAQASDLAGTVLSDRLVPFTITGGSGSSAAGTIQERVVQETRTKTLDFYYRITNSSASSGNVVRLKVTNFGGFSVAPGFRTDGLGTTSAQDASRNIGGDAITIDLKPIAPGQSSRFVLLMTNGVTSDDSASLTIFSSAHGGVAPISSTTVATDHPTS